MTNTHLQEALELTKYLMRSHYCDQNSKELIKYFSPKISWLGTGEEECLYNYRAIVDYFNQSTDMLPRCIIEDEDFRIVFSTETVCIVSGRCYIRTSDESQMILRVHQRVTFVYEWENEQWKIIHIHASNPYEELAGEDFFPSQTGQETYTYFKQLLAEKTELIEMMTSTMEGGLKGSNDDDTYSYFYVNDGLPKMLGYTYEEFMEASNGCAVDAVYPPDLPQALEDCDACFAKGPVYSTQYRMQKKDGSLIWVMDSGKKFKNHEGKVLINSMITDITPLRTALQELELEKERYQVALGNISDKLFEYDASLDICSIYEKDENGITAESRYDNFLDRLRSSHYFDEENYEKLRHAYYNDRSVNIELSVDQADCKTWLAVQFRTLYDDMGKPYRSIGTLRNITEEVNSNQELMEKAQLDSLTSVYNPETFKEKVNECLSAAAVDASSAFLLLDLDDFKYINDRMGHLFGNAVLISVANCLKKTCSNSDFAGRIGGDEFAVFLSKADREEASHAAEEIVSNMSKIFNTPKEGVAVGCSIGIHIARPDAPQSFESLFIAADKALYRIKNHGKNSWCFYDDLVLDGSQEFMTYTDTKQFSIDQESNKDSSTKERMSTIALEILNRADSFDVAANLVMEVVGSQYRLGRITIISGYARENDNPVSYQWTDRTTPVVPDSLIRLAPKDYSLFRENFDSNGICVVRADEFDAYSERARAFLLHGGAKTVLYIAMYIGGQFCGVIAFADCKTMRTWTTEEKKGLSEIAKIIASHMDRDTMLKTASIKVEYYKSFDALTGLFSLSRFREDCQKMLEASDTDYAIIYSDIKDFKYVNETVGYTQGDRILRAFAKVLSSLITPESRCARADGDQFVAFVPWREGRDALLDSVMQLNNKFCSQQNRVYDNLNFRIRSGIYFIEPDCREISVAIDRANTARQSMQHIQTSKSAVYNDAIAAKISQETRMTNRMDYALSHDEFQVYLQPLVRLRTREIIGAEALVRWQTPEGKILYPDEFIPLFEKNGFITKLDAHVLSSICASLYELEKGKKKIVPVSANISCLNAQNEDLITQVRKVAHLNNVSPNQLSFELTETAFIQDTEHVAVMMESLRQNGFGTAVDDFGAGHSLLNMIADVPADTIKIDRQFLLSCERTSRGTEFLKQLLSMLHNLGYSTLCEGIETERQLELLTRLGCDIGQGFIFSKPVPMAQFFEDLQTTASFE